MKKTHLRDMVTIALCSAILVAGQVALAALPNIEIVSLLVIVYTLVLGWRVYPTIYIFALLEGLIYGFTFWWFTYLYVWTILALIATVFRRVETPIAWAIISGGYGLAFGLLCEIPYIFVIGFPAALAAYISGIPFDLLHCGGNFVVALLLVKPLRKALSALYKGRSNLPPPDSGDDA